MKGIKRMVSAVLAAALLVCCLSVSAAAKTTEEDVSQYPVIYMTGSWGSLYVNEGTPEAKTIFSSETSVPKAIEENKDQLLEQLKALDIDSVGDTIVDMIWGIFGPIQMDKNGNSVDPSVTRISNNYKITNNTVKFNFDWRKDPMILGEELHEYIEWMLDKTGAEKVNIQAISGSGQILMCYIANHGSGKLASAVFNITMQNGSDTFGALATRNFEFDMENLTRSGGLTLLGSQISFGEFTDWLPWLYEPGVLDVLGKILKLATKSMIDKLYDEALIPLLFTIPGIWAYVPMENYEQAKTALFKGSSDYDVLVERMDTYRKEVMSQQDKIMLDLAEKIKVAVRVSYGQTLLPIFKGSYQQADSMVDVKHASFGATCADMGTKFFSSYKQKEDCGHNHISPDRVIDASTCLLPEQTWFARNQPHVAEYQYSGWYDWFLRTDEVTVNNEAFPQFTDCEKRGVYVELEPEEVTWKDTLIVVLRWALKAWRWILMLPLFWVDLVA